MNIERWLLTEATGDPANRAAYILLRVTPHLLESLGSLLCAAVKLSTLRAGAIDVTERGEVDFRVISDLPEGDKRPDLIPWVESIESHEFDRSSSGTFAYLFPEGFDGEDFFKACKALRTDCHGMQVWAASKHGRLTCYPKEASYRIESAQTLHEDLERLREDFHTSW